MLVLSDGERISMIRSAVLTQYTRVTDGRTDGQTELAWHIRAIAYMLSRVNIVVVHAAFNPFVAAIRGKRPQSKAVNDIYLRYINDIYRIYIRFFRVRKKWDNRIFFNCENPLKS